MSRALTNVRSVRQRLPEQKETLRTTKGNNAWLQDAEEMKLMRVAARPQNGVTA